MESKPTKECDLVMKGGTTSGTLYPKAIQQIMKKYRLVNIGGTSAGAIAAAAAAAAEIGRDHDSEHKLEQLAESLPGKLLSFFQPRKEASFLFDIGLAWINNKTPLQFVVSLTKLWAKQYVKSFSIFAILIFVCGLAIGTACRYNDMPKYLWLAIIAILATILYGIFWLVISIYRSYRLAKKQLSESNGFGICPGASQSWAGKPAFTDWFSERLNDLAGIKDSNKPLTFGDLNGDHASNKNAVNLVVLSTSVTDGRMVKIPFEQSESYLFLESDWAGKIPANALSWMIKNSRTITLPDAEKGEREYHYLPETKELPVIVAVRMSMSFPLLFTTTKLYRIRDQYKAPQPVVFTDGGVTSNFPIHFFDNIWPSRPTFGITLDRTDSTNLGALAPRFGTEISEEGIPRQLSEVRDFISALLSTMQDWSDNEQSNLLSARQRIVRIPLLQEEGGLNLTMPPELIDKLIERGRKAGEKFGEFDEEQHRWTRFVSSMVSFAESHAGMKKVWNPENFSENPSLREFVENYSEAAVKEGQTIQWQEIAVKFAEHLMSDNSPAAQVYQQPGHEVGVRIVSK